MVSPTSSVLGNDHATTGGLPVMGISYWPSLSDSASTAYSKGSRNPLSDDSETSSVGSFVPSTPTRRMKNPNPIAHARRNLRSAGRPAPSASTRLPTARQAAAPQALRGGGFRPRSYDNNHANWRPALPLSKPVTSSVGQPQHNGGAYSCPQSPPGNNHYRNSGVYGFMESNGGGGMNRDSISMGTYFRPCMQIGTPFAPPILLTPGDLAYPFYYHETNVGASSAAYPPMCLPMAGHQIELRGKILKQIEYYFSEDNLPRDPYLRSKMDGEGWVPIALVAGFNLVAELTETTPEAYKEAYILDILGSSNVVEVQNEKIRRRNDWKRWPLHLPPNCSLGFRS